MGGKLGAPALLFLDPYGEAVLAWTLDEERRVVWQAYDTRKERMQRG